MWLISRFICEEGMMKKAKDTSFLPSFLKEKLKLLYQEKVDIRDAQIQSLR